MRLFKRKNPSGKPTICITNNQLTFNGKPFFLPISIDELDTIIDSPKKTSGSDVCWKSLGVSASPNKKGVTTHLSIHTGYDSFNEESEEDQKPYFTGEIVVDEHKIDLFSFENYDMRKFSVTRFPEDEPACLITIQYKEAFDTEKLGDSEMVEWLYGLGLNPELNDWTTGITLSTVSIENWLYKRNQLKPEDLKLDLTALSRGSWVVSLERHDGLYVAQWRPDNNFSIESAQLKYNRIIKWPKLDSLDDFPLLIAKIENILDVKFIRHADIRARFIDLSSHYSDSKLSEWLAPCADTLGANMSLNDPNEKKEPKVIIKTPPKNDYTIKPVDEKVIDFKDFGFKLSIIQELMYASDFLKPVFNVRDFANWYSERTIDIEEEGYEPIPEVVQYFRDLPIPMKFASEITEISQDGGNEIYLNLIPFADGWEEYWDIENIEDLKHFPNLKKAILCYAKKNIVDDFKGKGVDADWV